jgi:DNA-binding MarR family transcriptional regulator
MKLEEEIAQRGFRDDFHKAGINLIHTYNWLTYQSEKHFKLHDITHQQFNVLRILRGQYPEKCNLKLVRSRMLDRMSDVSRIVEKLCKRGLIDRTECPADRRNVDLLITDSGLHLLQQMDYLDAEFSRIFSSLSQVEVQHLNSLLDKLRG